MNSLNDLDYKNGTIAKKIIYNSETGTVLELAFETGTGLDMHTAPGDVVVQVLEGEIIFTVEDVENRMKTADYIVLKAGVEHSLKAVSRAKILVSKFLKP